MKKTIINIIVLAVITFVVLYFSLKDNFTTIVNLMLNIKVEYLVAVAVSYLLYIFLKSYTMYKISKKFNPNYSLKESFTMGIETNFFHAITPFSTGGQPYEIYRLSKNNIGALSATNISIQNFIVYQISLVLLGTVAIVYNEFFNLFKDITILNKLVFLGFFINFIVIVALFLITFSKKIKKFLLTVVLNVLSKIKKNQSKDDIKNKINSYLDEFNLGAKILLENKMTFIKLILIQFGALILYYISPIFIINGLGININAINVIVASAYVMLIGSFVPIPGGTGGIEYGFVVFFGSFINGNILTAVMLLWRFLTYYLFAIIGAITLAFRKKA